MSYFLKTVLIGVFISSISLTIYAQESRVANNTKQNNQAIYLELLGMGGLYSLNYEHRIGKKLWLRAGLSYFPDIYENFATLPLGLIYLKGDQNKYLEMGIGSTIFTAGSDNLLGFDFNDDDGRIFSASIQGIIGYRYMPEDENFIFKVSLYPVYFPESNSGLVTLGLSVGSSF